MVVKILNCLALCVIALVSIQGFISAAKARGFEVSESAIGQLQMDCMKNPFAVGCRGISAKRDPNWSGVGFNAPVVAPTDNTWTHQLALVPQNQLVLDLARWRLNSQLADSLFASRVASSSSSASTSFNGGRNQRTYSSRTTI